MALGTKEALRSSARWGFHVFLSFRGEDTRKTFTDHLYEALQRKGIKTFRDDEEIAKGQVISLQLPKAIEESLSYIVVLSPNYASSTWCLDELQKILESRKKLGGEVFPIFYSVDPSHVRHQRGTFETAMRKHEDKFGKDSEKIQNWRAALEEIANTSGWDDTQYPLETQLIEKIAEAVWSRIKDKLPSCPNSYVGMDSKIKEIDSLLEMGLDDVRFVGIWGMGGIGKTTLARVVFERIEHNFEFKCFLHNVREVSERSDGLPCLQKRILSRLKLRDIEIDHPDDGKNLIRNLLCNKKVLLVLDDINHSSQLRNLAGMQDWFGPGSRVIVTTRDKHLLKSHGVCKTYEVQLLRSSESLRLFYQKAFKKDQSEEGFLDLSKDVIKYAGCLPLALEVLGSYLYGKSIAEWESAMDRMRQFPEDDILRPLRVSYEALNVPNKTIFLDLACLLKGMDNDQVIQIMERCGLYVDSGIKDLIDKSLLTQYFDNDGKWHLEMHQMLQEMGKNIVLQESPFDPSKRSRLWSHEDINRVLTNNKGSKLIQWIVLEFPEPYEAQWHPEAFSKMCNLRLLILSNVHLPRGLNCLPSALKVLEWKGYPLKFLPLDVGLDELVDLKLHHSKIKQCWNGTQGNRGHVVLQFPGSEVPSWFENRSFSFDEDSRNRFDCDSAITILVNIPNSWRSSEWAGIAVCVVLDGQVMDGFYQWERVIFWSSKYPDEDEWTHEMRGYDVQGRVDRPELFIRFFPFKPEGEHADVEKNQLQLLLATETLPRRRRGDQLLPEPKTPRPSKKLEIKKCGWRALCKDDVDEYWRLSASTGDECNSSGITDSITMGASSE